MKTKKQIQAQIKRLAKISSAGPIATPVCSEAYEAYHSLRWVIENVSWSPASMLEKVAKEQKLI